MLIRMAELYPAPQLVDPVEVHINHFFDRVVACANHRRMTLLNAAHEKRQEMAARVTEREHSEQQLLSARAEIGHLLRENFLQETQEHLLAEIEHKLAVLRAPIPDTYLVFRGECGQLEQLIGGAGEIYEEKIKEEEVPAVPEYHKMQPIVAVAKKGEAPGELWWPNCVAIEPTTNQIYIAEGMESFARVSVFSESGEYLSSYTNEQMESLWGIAIHGNNLYVTDVEVSAVFHLKIEPELFMVARLGSRGSDIGQFGFPNQICSSANGDLYIADTSNDRIQILDGSLHPIRNVTHPSINEPNDVKLTAEEMFVISSVEFPCVHVFTHSGDKIRSLITRGVGMQVTDPKYFCLDIKKNLIIGDWDSDQFKVFSNEGTLLHTIGEYGQEVGKFYMPQGLALTSNQKLVTISWNDNYRLQIFSVL